MAQPSQQLYEFGQFRLDANKRALLREGELVQLTPKCFEILLTLIERGVEGVSKDDLIQRVWPDTFVEEGNLTYNISMLRKALGERAAEHQYILTVPGHGYRFIGTEHRVSEVTTSIATEAQSSPSTRGVLTSSRGGR